LDAGHPFCLAEPVARVAPKVVMENIHKGVVQIFPSLVGLVGITKKYRAFLELSYRGLKLIFVVDKQRGSCST
jgi:hypothetical protein